MLPTIDPVVDPPESSLALAAIRSLGVTPRLLLLALSPRLPEVGLCRFTPLTVILELPPFVDPAEKPCRPAVSNGRLTPLLLLVEWPLGKCISSPDRSETSEAESSSELTSLLFTFPTSPPLILRVFLRVAEVTTELDDRDLVLGAKRGGGVPLAVYPSELLLPVLFRWLLLECEGGCPLFPFEDAPRPEFVGVTVPDPGSELGLLDANSIDEISICAEVATLGRGSVAPAVPLPDSCCSLDKGLEALMAGVQERGSWV